MTGILASAKGHFSRFLDGGGDRLHLAAHSHHPWPDVTFEAHQQAWLDAATHHDAKWDHFLGDVLPDAQRHLAWQLRLPEPSSVTFAPNTHEFISRILSCFEGPIRILTTDAEFHSFRRQVDRLAEDGIVELERVAAQPFDTFTERFVAAAAKGGHDIVFLSSVQFDSGAIVTGLHDIVDAVPNDETFIVIDGYHQFMAMPMDLSRIADRVFFLAGGYKYAMAGEGACFLHVPPGYGMRPRFTGWYAEFGDLEKAPGQQVAYTTDATRFAGSTYDISGIHRLVAVQEWLQKLAIDAGDIHSHVRELQDLAFERVMDAEGLPFGLEDLVPGFDLPDRGNFLTFRTNDAGRIRDALDDAGVTVDHRGDRLRIGFGIYHDPADVDVFFERLTQACATL